MGATFRHRGLVYDAGAPFDAEEGQGTLALDTELDGAELPAGTEIFRDIDFGYVTAVLARPATIYGLRLPARSTIHLYRANPRSPAAVALGVALAPLLILLAVFIVFIGVWELLTGRWRPWRRDGAVDSRPAIRASIHLREPALILSTPLEPGDSINVYANSMIEVIRRQPSEEGD
jgi:hypothetical protein